VVIDPGTTHPNESSQNRTCLTVFGDLGYARSMMILEFLLKLFELFIPQLVNEFLKWNRKRKLADLPPPPPRPPFQRRIIRNSWVNSWR
jgi:hypothetical protein